MDSECIRFAKIPQVQLRFLGTSPWVHNVAMRKSVGSIVSHDGNPFLVNQGFVLGYEPDDFPTLCNMAAANTVCWSNLDDDLFFRHAYSSDGSGSGAAGALATRTNAGRSTHSPSVYPRCTSPII